MNVKPGYQNSNATVDLSCKAVIFDMDGTLIESTEADYLAWKWLFEDYNHSLSFHDYMPMLGIKSVDVIKSRLDLTPEEMNKALQQKMAYFKEVVANNGIRTVPFVNELLKGFKKYPVHMALATSSRKEKMRLLMEKLNLLQYFDVIVTGEEVKRGKPAPDIFLQAAERLQVLPEACVVVEDTVHGVAAAKNANMKCVAIATTHTADLLQQADLVIDTFEKADLKDWCSLFGS